jgi:hypothetical protein
MALLVESRPFSRKVAFRLCRQYHLSLHGRRCPVALRIHCTRMRIFQRRILRTREAMSRLHQAMSCIAHIYMGFLAWVRFDHLSPRAGFVFIMKIPLGNRTFARRLESVDLWDKEDGRIVLSHMRSREVWCWGKRDTREADCSHQGNLELRPKPYGNGDLVHN